MMKADPWYRALVMLFGMVAACVSLSASRWLLNGLFPLWVVCCQVMRMGMGAAMAARPVALAVTALLLVGLGVAAARFWKTQRFSARLGATVVTVPPTRLTRILTRLEFSQPVVVLATQAPLAFCFGLLRPRLCMSTGLVAALSNHELEAVLLHEEYHRRRRDPLRRLVAEAVAAILFFLPVAAELRDLFLASAELEADRYAASRAGRPTLAGALHKILTHPLAPDLTSAGVAGIQGVNSVDLRIADLLGDATAPLSLSARSLITSSAMLVLVCLLV